MTAPAAARSAPEGLPVETLSIGQLVISGLALALSAVAALGLAALGLITRFSEMRLEPGSASLLFSTAWISLLVGLLAVPSIYYSVQRLRGAPGIARLEPSAPRALRLAGLLLLVWPLVLLLGNLISAQPQIAWLLLPPLQIAAALIPTWWLVEIARRGLRSGSAQRGWGLVVFSIFITTPLLMVVEILVFVALLVVVVAVVMSQPALMNELQRLAEQLMVTPPEPETVLPLLLPYLENPWVIAGLLGVTAVLVPMVEEFFKPLAVWLLAGRRISPGEGFVAGALSGAGFALVESLFYLSNPAGDGWAALAAGRAGTILLHIGTTALVGWGMASAWRAGRYGRLALAYLAAVALHGLWNGLAVLSGVSVALQDQAASGGSLPLLARAAPVGIGLLAAALFVLLWAGNRRLRSELAAAPEPPGPVI